MTQAQLRNQRTLYRHALESSLMLASIQQSRGNYERAKELDANAKEFEQKLAEIEAQLK